MRLNASQNQMTNLYSMTPFNDAPLAQIYEEVKIEGVPPRESNQIMNDNDVEVLPPSPADEPPLVDI